jgi:uncharacterized membrane protein
MSVAAIALAFVAVTEGEAFGAEWVSESSWLYLNGPDGARALLATVAGSMITVAGVVFSITLLMVSHAGSQIGPRVVSGFMRDRGSQVVLGTFIATFLYCLMVLRTVTTASGDGPQAVDGFVPRLAVIIAVVMAVLSVAVLIYFIHHVPTQINVSTVTNRIGETVLQQLGEIFPESVGQNASQEKAAPDVGNYADSNCVHTVCLESPGGYLRVVNDDGLMELARKHGTVLETLVVPGVFCVRGTPLIRIHTEIEAAIDDCKVEFQSLFSWGGDRTQDQDILFLIDQLAEISGKALSPGINDQFTAIGCIDQMERILRELCERPEPQSLRFDDDGNLRVIARRVSLSDVADHFIRPMRQFSHGDYLTTKHLIEMLGRTIDASSVESALHRTLQSHFDALRSDGTAAIPSDSLRKGLEVRSQEIEATLQRIDS